ncbi:MAG: acyltransferase [Psychromonas sp.]|nr:acyltransferase [Alteromonadales bacterium]MCP5078226.1 acyltransferase [Psychromonas sp.]
MKKLETANIIIRTSKMNIQPKAGNSGFNYALHGLRGLAALAVYLAHSVDGYREHLCQQCSSAPLMESIYFLGAYGVEIFFFLSGYVIFSASLKSDLNSFFKHRFWRIYPIFLFFTLLYFALNHFIQKEPDKDSLEILFYNLLFLDRFSGTGPLSPNAWSLTFEVWFYIMTFMLLRPIILKERYFFSIIAVILWCIFIWKFPICLYYIAGVATNIAVKRYKSFFLALNSKFVNSLQLSSLCIVLYYASKSDYRYHWEFMIGNQDLWLLMVAFVLFMSTLFCRTSMLSRLLQTKVLMHLGTISYTLYLAHPYSYLVARMSAQKLTELGLPTTQVAILYVILNLVLTTVFVYLVFIFIEKRLYQLGTGKKIFTPILKAAPEVTPSSNA